MKIDPYIIHPDHLDGMIDRMFNLEFISDQYLFEYNSLFSCSLWLHPV